MPNHDPEEEAAEAQATGSRRSLPGGPLDDLRARVIALEAHILATRPLHPDPGELQASIKALSSQVAATEKWCHEVLSDLQALTGRVDALEARSPGEP